MANYNPSEIIGTPIAEGVRIEIGEAAVYAVRNEQRDITVRVRRETHYIRNLLGKLPFIRGVVRLLSALFRLFAGLGNAADLKPQAVVRGGTASRAAAALFRTRPQTLWTVLGALMIPAILALFILGLPALVGLALSRIGDLPRFAVNIVSCAFRVGGAILSIYMIGRLRVVNRLCMYRGAVSKVVNAFETHGPELTHEDVLLSSRLTQRSDGAFAIIVMILSIIAFACVRTDSLSMQLAYRIGILLAAAAVANELIRPLENAHPDSLLALLGMPLISLQHLFTIEPHNQMIEVAVCAFRAAYENDLP